MSQAPIDGTGPAQKLADTERPAAVLWSEEGRCSCC